ncbi:MAG: DUF6263 family protein, partial [Phycisphaerae bacterium]|nr:DUF6263 family protein [Phycisphaerae bacterium]
ISADDNGTMSIDFFYKFVKMDINSPPQHIIYESSTPKPAESNDVLLNAIWDVYSAVIGDKLRITASPAGQTSDIEGFDKVRKKIKEIINNRLVAEMNIPDGQDKEAVKVLREMMLAGVKKQMELFYNNILSSIISGTQEMIDSMIIKYPEWQVSAGSKWYGSSRLSLGFVVDANTTYIFKRCENSRAYIDVISHVDMGKNFKITEINNRETIKKCISGVRSSSNVVNESTGLLERSEAIIKFNGAQRIEPDKLIAPLSPTMTIPIKIAGTTVIELIE